MAYIMFNKQNTTRRNTLKAQLVHPCLGTSHSKSVGGGAQKTPTPNQGETWGQGK